MSDKNTHSVDKVEVHQLGIENMDPWGNKLREFERQFWYPLGSNRKFRIEHPGNYTAFFESIGKATCFLAVEDETVIGVLSVAIRDSRGISNSKDARIAYIADIKIAQERQGSGILGKLISHVFEWLSEIKITSAYSVVMDGTAKTPDLYTGRNGIPEFKRKGRVALLNLPTKESVEHYQHEMTIDFLPNTDDGSASLLPVWINRNLVPRSVVRPNRILDMSNGVQGMLEDTRRTKILYDEKDSEIMFAHLSYFYYHEPEQMLPVIEAAIRQAHALGFTDLLVSVPYSRLQTFTDSLDSLISQTFTATIYGTGFDTDISKLVYSSEI
ncbi:MAG: GNAT family N-acetyltransferase [Gammaproteobacteria bacterium]|nr:GNAT family N-acetyltransferase [Gammaproteobacteria bacterium]MDE0251607.1 GNAT family N-acetyltransferase [Gammaproteobacteria bacterium]MDE0403383.1 GNAT family N-acetyltransferase [Gammaproteobacteria bacterium]